MKGLLTKYRRFAVVGGILFLAFWLGKGLLGLSIGYNLNNFFSEDSEEIQFYADYKAAFEEENNFLMLGIRKSEALDLTTFYTTVAAFGRQLETVSGIEAVNSPLIMKRTVRYPVIGVKKVPVFAYETEEQLAQSLTFIYETPTLYRNFFSADTNSILVYLLIEPGLEHGEKKTLLSDINYQFEQCKKDAGIMLSIAGQTRTKVFYTQALKSELLTFSGISLGILVILLIFIYRHGLLVFFSVLTLLLGVVISMGIIQVYGAEMDFLKTMIPTLLFAIGVSNIIHVFSTYRHEKEEKVSANDYDWFLVRKSTFISCLTTAIGFLSFYALPVKPVGEFGLYAAISIMVVWSLTAFFLPVLLEMFDRLIQLKPVKGGWERQLDQWFSFLASKRKVVIISSTVLLLLSLQGVYSLRSNSFFLDDLNADSPLKKEMLALEKDFGGIRPFEMAVMTPNSQGLTYEFLKDLEAIDGYLMETYGVKMYQSIPVALKEANVAMNGGNYYYYEIPKEQRKIDRLFKVITKNSPDLMAGMMTERNDSIVYRITGKIPDWGAATVQAKNDGFNEFIAPYSGYKARLTGAAHLMDKVNVSISAYVLKGLGFSLSLVFVILLVLLRSFRMALLALLPNVFPLMLVCGIMGWMGVELKIGTAMIFTVIFGIAVDDSIHFLMGYLQERKSNNSEESLRLALRHTGKKLMLTSIILGASFATFTLSDFQSTYYAGVLVTLGILIALFSDLIQLPVLILWAEGERSKIDKNIKMNNSADDLGLPSVAEL